MSYFPGMKLTKQGEQLLAKVNGNLNETINFKRAELGSGKIDSLDEIRFLTALKEKWKNVSINDCKVVDGEEVQVQLEIQFDNADFTKDMLLNEIGIYAAGKDDIEVLFAYTNALDRGEDLPIAKDNPQSFIINVLIGITSATKVDAVIDLNSYVSLRKLKEELDKKEDKISLKNTAFNKNFGLLEGEVLEGHRLAQALGLEFAGELNNVNLKQAGKAYWDNVNKSIYKCLVDNTLNYAESTKFEALSNHDLLLKLQNLYKVETYYKTYDGIAYVFKRIGNLIFYNSSNKINSSVVGRAKIFTIDNPRFIPKTDAYICSVVSLSPVFDGSISPTGEIILNFGSSPIQPFIAIQGIGIAKD